MQVSNQSEIKLNQTKKIIYNKLRLFNLIIYNNAQVNQVNSKLITITKK